jgi:ABC-2 type transport system ATP-binding protein
MAVVEVEQLTRRFKELVAVDHISFGVKEGELFGLLGPNGAGKTTTINMLCTLLDPTEGEARVCGAHITRDRRKVRQCIEVLFQETALDEKLTARENLYFHALMYGIKGPECRKRISAVLELVQLTGRADTIVGDYSSGMKRRLGIARCFLRKPMVLFLDEPSLGLDAQSRRLVWEHIRLLKREEGTTVILTTHYMEEADALCERVAIMDKGVIKALDTPTDLKNALGGDVVTLAVETCGEVLAGLLRSEPWATNVTLEGNGLRLTTAKGNRQIPEILRMADAKGILIQSVDLHRPSMEDVFIHLTGKSLRDEGPSQAEKLRGRMH